MDAPSPQQGGPAEWFIDQHGKPVGPLTLEQVLQSYHEARITGTTRITAKRLSGQWISVQEWIEFFGRSASSEKNPTPQAPKMSLPSRPDNVNERTMTLEVGEVRKKPDAAENLFDALTTIKEKQTHPHPPRKDRRVWGEMPSKRKVPVQVWIAAASIAMLVGVIWGLTRMLDRKIDSKPDAVSPGAPIQARDLATQHRSEPKKPAPTPVQPISRPAPEPVVVKSARDEEREREEAEERERERIQREMELKQQAELIRSQQDRGPAGLEGYQGSDSPVPPDQPPPPPKDPNEVIPDHSHPSDPLYGGQAID